MRRTIQSTALAILLFHATAYFLAHLASLPINFDPDSLFHLGLLQESLQQNTLVLRKLPELPQLGWDQYFSDKEFLFHFLMNGLGRIFSSTQVVFIFHFVASAVLLLPFLFAPKNKVFALALSLSLWACNENLASRLSLLRPHTLALAIFTALLWLIFDQAVWPLFALATAFSLSYHALYIPLLVALLLPGLALIEKRSLYLKQAGALTLGIAAGSVANPYFPSNLIRTLQHLALALRGSQMAEALHFQLGAELLPMTAEQFLLNYGIVSLGFVVGIFFYLSKILKKQDIEASTPLWAALSLILWVAALRSPRAMEFAFPPALLFFYFIFRDQNKNIQWALILFMALGQSIPFYLDLKENRKRFFAPPPYVIESILEKIPKDKSITIYHCNWGLGPYLFYYRPKAKLIDLLDPSYLLLAAPRTFILRNELNAGHLADPSAALRKTFSADFVLCENFPLIQQLEQSSDWHLIASDPRGIFKLFQLKEAQK